MARKTYHRKDGRFSSFIAAHSVVDDGKRYEIVRTLKQVGGAKADDAKSDTKAPPRVDVAGSIQAAKGKAAMVSGAVSRGGWVPMGAISQASVPTPPASVPASEEVVIDEEKFSMDDYPSGFEAGRLMMAVFYACQSSGERWPTYSGQAAEMAGKKEGEKVTINDMMFAENWAKVKKEKGIAKIVREARMYFKGR